MVQPDCAIKQRARERQGVPQRSPNAPYQARIVHKFTEICNLDLPHFYPRRNLTIFICQKVRAAMSLVTDPVPGVFRGDLPLGRPDLQDDESSWGCFEPTCRSIAGNVPGSVAFGWRIFRDLSTVCRVTFVDVYEKLTEGSLRRFLYAAGCFQNTNRFVGGMFAFIHYRRTGSVLIAFSEPDVFYKFSRFGCRSCAFWRQSKSRQLHWNDCGDGAMNAARTESRKCRVRVAAKVNALQLG